jgi:hypothetical protein
VYCASGEQNPAELPSFKPRRPRTETCRRRENSQYWGQVRSQRARVTHVSRDERSYAPSILISGQEAQILEFKGATVSRKYSEITRPDVLDEAGTVVDVQQWLVRGYCCIGRVLSMDGKVQK